MANQNHQSAAKLPPPPAHVNLEAITRAEISAAFIPPMSLRQHEKFSAALIPVKEGMTSGTSTKLSQEVVEPNFDKINPEAPHLEATCHQPDNRHKRKMVDQDQPDARNSKTRVNQPQYNPAPTTVPLITPGPTLVSSMQISRDNDGGQPQQNKTTQARMQCFKCQDSIPEATLIATITPAASGKNNRKYMSQLRKYRSLGLPMPQETIVNQSASLLLPNTSIGVPSQKNSSHAAGIKCFNCHQMGHYANNCPLKKASSTEHLQKFRMNVQHSAQLTPLTTFGTTEPTLCPAVSGFGNSNQPQGNNNSAPGVTCYRCHEMGHYAHSCPQKRQGMTPVPLNLGAIPARITTPGAGQGTTRPPSQATRTSLPSARGRVNQVTIEPVQHVVPGKF
uniref:Putative retrotransposon protein n=1 Tax=Phyllostachys edulis TaxID=38705 RepID=D3IVS9_PHYED|nr:putative retrotransposon protein [Phyllostachys edulis]